MIVTDYLAFVLTDLAKSITQTNQRMNFLADDHAENFAFIVGVGNLFVPGLFHDRLANQLCRVGQQLLVAMTESAKGANIVLDNLVNFCNNYFVMYIPAQ